MCFCSVLPGSILCDHISRLSAAAVIELEALTTPPILDHEMMDQYTNLEITATDGDGTVTVCISSRNYTMSVTSIPNLPLTQHATAPLVADFLVFCLQISPVAIC